MTNRESTASAPAGGTVIRPLTAVDREAVIAIDHALSGRSRRGFFERRLAHAERDPAGFVAFAAERDGRLIGFVLARLFEGEFGATSREAALDAIGVAPALARQHGVNADGIERDLARGRARCHRR